MHVSHKELTETEPVYHEHEYTAVSDVKHKLYGSSHTLVYCIYCSLMYCPMTQEGNRMHTMTTSDHQTFI